MSAIDKPLFRPEALRNHLKNFSLPSAMTSARQKLAEWASKLSSYALDKSKETELLPEFLSDVFIGVLGYIGRPSDPYTLRREALVRVDGKFADAALGNFTQGTEDYRVVLEGKGPKDPLDRPFAGRKRSAVEQALNYAVQLKIDWYLVTNLKEIRLFHKGHDTHTFERFELTKLVSDDHEFRRFVFLLGAERLLAQNGPHLNALLADSASIGQKLTRQFYQDYRDLREFLFTALRDHNPQHNPGPLLAATQKILDRILFVAFCEDRGLLPGDIIKRAFQHRDDFNPRPVWQNFIGLFRSIDKGNDGLNIWKYNGGLFADDVFLNELVVPDQVCEHFKRLADYEFGIVSAEDTEGAHIIDVEILGHIFEQSISDLEELQRALTTTPAEPTRKAPTKRKQEGAFYTPDFITRYIVAETLGTVLRERFERLRESHQGKAAPRTRKVLDDPRAFDVNELTAPQQLALRNFWEGWIEQLETVKVVDPSCGSGAFLIEAFDQLFLEYAQSQGYLTELQGGKSLFDVQRTILTKNLFGMDLNGEAVEIARLSCWIKTAEKGKELTALDENIQIGNSVVAEPDPLTAWKQRFPDVFANGGFDVVIGNPPYVRQEWITADKPFLQRHYQAYNGVADLYVYFYELGLNVLKPSGRLGFIVTNKWMKAGYGEALRKHYGESAWVEQVIDFGHAKQIFPDADVFPCILVARKPSETPPPESARVCVIPREQLRIDDLSRQIATEGVAVPRTRFGPEPWNLEPPGVARLMEKIKANGVPLKEFAGVGPLRGILTGFNEAFLIDTATKKQLVTADPKSEPLFRPYLRGQDIDRWEAEWNELWMIAMKSSGNYQWPWTSAGDDAEAVFQKTYPALFGHFIQFREPLVKRQDQGENWWELRACAYWDEFNKPKLIYPEITWRASWCADDQGYYINNTVYIIPQNNLWLLAAMNSPVAWAFSWRNAQHGKDEALRFIREFVQIIPIPRPTDEARAIVEADVRQVIALTREANTGRRAVLDWLRMDFGIEKPTQKLANLAGLSTDEFITEVKKIRGRKAPLSVVDVKRLREEHFASVVPLQGFAREIAGLEVRISAQVNAAFGLTPDEVKLMWNTAPPRMPIPRPSGI